MQPSTVASRRRLWGNDARQLVSDLAKAARGEGGEPWRIAYIAGAGVGNIANGALPLRLHRIKPHMPSKVGVRLDGTQPTLKEIDAITWHMDQDVKRGDEDEVSPLPAGPLLTDAVTAGLLQAAGKDEIFIRNQIESEIYNGNANRRSHIVSLRTNEQTTRVELEFNMNEVRAKFILPGGAGARWRNGYLETDIGANPIPETMMLGMRKHLLRDVIKHPLFERTDIIITSATHNGNAIGINTNANTPAQLVPIPCIQQALAA